MCRKASRLFYLALFSCLLLFAALPAYAAKLVWKPTRFEESELNAKSFCTMKTEYPVYKTGVSTVYVELTNNTRKTLIYGVDFTLERKHADGWYYSSWEYNKGDTYYEFTASGYEIAPKGTLYTPTSLDLWGGPLPAGEYRIIKHVFPDEDVSGGGYFCAYFTVSDSGYDAMWLSGYAPLDLLPKAYGEQAAIENGDFYVDAKGKAYNAAAMKTFLEKALKHVAAKVRVYSTDNSGSPVITDITCRGGGNYPAFLVERDESRTTSGRGVVKNYYSMLRTKKAGGKTGLYLTDTKVKEHALSEDMLLLPNVAVVGKSLCSKAEKEFTQSGYIIYADNQRTTFSYYDGEFAWSGTTGTGASEWRGGTIADEEGHADKLLRMTFTGKDEVTLIFSYKGQKKMYCIITFDIMREAVTSINYTTSI